uniref:Uncharacterized protein n=1 Tax=Acrobeloides nanus TaxID=290746 RepID=A0A914EJM7_9BILA
MFRLNLSLFNFVITIFGFFILNYRIHNSQNLNDFSKNERMKISSIILYNRIPKTGSTSLTNAIAYDLCAKNGFNVIHLNMTKNRFAMNIIDQASFIKNVTSWSTRLPAFYHGHVAFIDFSKFGYPNPIYINMVREPFERLLSHYYFLRYGDNYRVGLKRSKADNNETFDECVLRDGKDCQSKQLWLQIPYFCGSHKFCSDIGNRLALETAKRNIVERYVLVGLTERMQDLISLLERILPDFFNGASPHFLSMGEDRKNLRHTLRKVAPSEATIEKIKSSQEYKMERELYDFVASEFENYWNRVMDQNGKTSIEMWCFSIESLKRAIKKAWDEMSDEMIARVVDTWPSRLQACIDADGEYIE